MPWNGGDLRRPRPREERTPRRSFTRWFSAWRNRAPEVRYIPKPGYNRPRIPVSRELLEDNVIGVDIWTNALSGIVPEGNMTRQQKADRINRICADLEDRFPGLLTRISFNQEERRWTVVLARGPETNRVEITDEVLDDNSVRVFSMVLEHVPYRGTNIPINISANRESREGAHTLAVHPGAAVYDQNGNYVGNITRSQYNYDGDSYTISLDLMVRQEEAYGARTALDSYADTQRDLRDIDRILDVANTEIPADDGFSISEFFCEDDDVED